MALQVALFDSAFGTVTNSYWRWDDLSVKPRDGMAIVILKGYLNKAAYDAGLPALGEKRLVASGDQFAQIGAVLEGVLPQQPLSTVIYNFAKEADEFFADAIAV